MFAFTRAFTAGTSIYRYRDVGPGDSVVFWSTGNSVFIYYYTFKTNVGMQRVDFISTTFPFAASGKHNLIERTLVGVPFVHEAIATGFELQSPYPNPFNSSTTISYQLPFDSHVTLKVFDVLGREVQTIINERKIAGFHTISFDASSLGSGIYFCQLRARNVSQTKRLVLIR